MHRRPIALTAPGFRAQGARAGQIADILVMERDTIAIDLRVLFIAIAAKIELST
jgi:hypothetical protein